MNKYVTCVQAEKLKTLGFNEPTSNYYRSGKIVDGRDRMNWNLFISLRRTSAPTVDEAIDWLRRKYNIHIYTCIEPFVDPTDSKGSVLYRYGVKWCDEKNGWNGRIVIGKTNMSKNPYSLKRQAITFALRWIAKNNIESAAKQCKINEYLLSLKNYQNDRH